MEHSGQDSYRAADHALQPVARAPLHSSGDASRLDGVAPRSTMPNMLPRRALPRGRLAALVLSRVSHGLLAAAGVRLRCPPPCSGNVAAEKRPGQPRGLFATEGLGPEPAVSRVPRPLPILRCRAPWSGLTWATHAGAYAAPRRAGAGLRASLHAESLRICRVRATWNAPRHVVRRLLALGPLPVEFGSMTRW